MLNLNGVLSVELIREIYEYTDLRLRDKNLFQTPEAIALYEQRMLPNDKILELCRTATGIDLQIPVVSYVPEDIIIKFIGSPVVPVSYSPMTQKVTCVYLPEYGKTYMPMQNIIVECIPTTIYNYFKEFISKFGSHPDLLEMPAKQLLTGVVNEAVGVGAADITISTTNNDSRLYYNVRKKKVYSQRILSASNVDDVIRLLCMESPMNDLSNEPKYVGVELNRYYRGRVVINKKYHGYEITIRLLPNAAFNSHLEDCNLTKETIEFIREYFMNDQLGLRLIVGATMSGKNTTILAGLNEIVASDRFKVVSVEMPVEQELDGIEQIDCQTEEEYALAIGSLLRQNPDLVYVTEMGDSTAASIMKVANTGKRVLSTLHANSCSDVVGRIMDLTGLSTDRIIQCLHSIIYQELVRDESKDMIYPKNRYVYLSQARKNKLYGKPFGEVVKLIQQWEAGDIW